MAPFASSENLCAHVGAEVDTTANPAPVVQTTIALRWPDFYVDMGPRSGPRYSLETIGNSTHALVRIDLYQDGLHGPELVLNITDSTPDDGQFSGRQLTQVSTMAR